MHISKYANYLLYIFFLKLEIGTCLKITSKKLIEKPVNFYLQKRRLLKLNPALPFAPQIQRLPTQIKDLNSDDDTACMPLGNDKSVEEPAFLGDLSEGVGSVLHLFFVSLSGIFVKFPFS